MVSESYITRFDLTTIFGRVAPLQVDLGCGEGSFLCELAERTPATNFLGVERLAGRVVKASRKGEQMENLRVLHLEVCYAIEYLLPAHSVEIFHLLFPDP